ncbi:uncharacterized protein EV420DRAFT_1523507 [Desarmillaria tabescens]|uniref:Uncharacterized protein n=1 Tax=Armillaria tabescens TaxID=1929756 RepID=A0AA39T461_ARMTA|nr:uncharacterized protein EV420DRAFT_1523507 [Desarmillaria tabescens]KAK0463256.1 hypothetical protein EV420DRAFT_1523507 [Desarmillaria tabescens]
MALDLSYIIPIFLRRVFQNHPEVMFKPGPFYMGDGFLGAAMNWTCILWTIFVCVIFSFPTVKPITKENMNYTSVITISVMVLAFAWYIVDGHRHYHGPQSNLGLGRSYVDDGTADEITVAKSKIDREQDHEDV